MLFWFNPDVGARGAWQASQRRACAGVEGSDERTWSPSKIGDVRMKPASSTLFRHGLLALAISLGAFSASAKTELIGINVAGAEFTSGELPGKHGTHYFFPPDDYFDRWDKRDIRMIRFPIKWERLQPALKGDFDDTYAELIDRMLDQAADKNMRIILDVHNYARFRGNVIGSDEVPFSAYRDLMERIAKRWHEHDGLYAYDIMNEPYGAADEHWPVAAQAGIDGVRKHDRKRPLYIEGVSWSSAARWPRYGDELLKLKDPADNMVFSAHVYIDSDASGTYSEGPAKNFDPMIGVRRVEPFVGWLKENNKRGHIGEFGIPADDERWLDAMDKLLAYLNEHCIPISYWAAGPSWGNYKLSIEPREGVERPQLDLLEKWVGKGDCKDYGPN
jgi:endoglucanase